MPDTQELAKNLLIVIPLPDVPVQAIQIGVLREKLEGWGGTFKAQLAVRGYWTAVLFVPGDRPIQVFNLDCLPDADIEEVKRLVAELVGAMAQTTEESVSGNID